MRQSFINNEEQRKYAELKSSFDQYYQSKLYPFLKEKETVRLKYLHRFVLMVVCAVLLFPLFSFLIYNLYKYFDSDFDAAPLYFVFIIAVYVVRGPYAKYRKEIKDDMMNLLIGIFPDFHYHGGRGLSDGDLTDSRIFPYYDRHKADDCFSGSYQGVRIRVCEELLEAERRTKNGTTWVKVFQGIAVELDMNKNFTGQTIVKKDHGIFNALNRPSGFERVKLEDVSFEKIFEVYSTNQIEARYLLTTGFMERLIKLKELYKGKSLQVSFRKNKIMIAISTNKDMFEPCSFFKTNLNKNRVDEVFEQIWTIFSIIYFLKLNHRIGL